MGASPAETLGAVRLVLMMNDISMRRFTRKELRIGFGLVRAKSATVFSPVAVTPDELGEAWANGRVQLDIHVSRKRRVVRQPETAARWISAWAKSWPTSPTNRCIGAGFMVGTGTVSNVEHEKVGSACLAERRALETIAQGAPVTPWMQYGERLRFDTLDAEGRSIFGAIDVKFVPSKASL